MTMSPLAASLMNPNTGASLALNPSAMMFASPQYQMGEGQLQEASSTAPAYPMQALARALQGVIGNYNIGQATNGFRGAQQGLAQELAQAANSPDPVSVLSASKNPLVQAMLPQIAEKQMERKAMTQQILAEQGLQYGNDGSVGAIPGYAGSKAGIAGQEAGATASAQVPPHILQALGEKGLTVTNDGQVVPIKGFGQAQVGAEGPLEAAKAGYGAQANAWAAQHEPKVVPAGEGAVLMSAQPGAVGLPGGGGGAVALPSGNGGIPPAPSLPQTPVAPHPTTSAPPAPMPASTGGLPHNPMTPETLEIQKGPLTEQFKDAQTQATAAQNARLQLREMLDQFNKLPNDGMLTPGTGGKDRAAFAKGVNSYLATVGANPAFDPDKIAATEDINKSATRLGFELAKTLGSREAAMIVQGAISANPGIENTKQGFNLVFRALDTAAQRNIDRASYLTNWQKQHGDTMGADIAFNNQYPVTQYSKLATIPQVYLDALKAHPDKAPQFDQKFGAGLGEIGLGINGGQQ